jgi:hypothetical protein
MKFHIRFWWAGYSPEEALESFDPVITQMAFEISQNGGKTWRPPANGADLTTVRGYMTDKGLSVVDTKLVGQRRNGSWEGRYVLTIGPSQ